MSEPILLKAFDNRLKLNDKTVPVDCYVVDAEKYDAMKAQITELEQQVKTLTHDGEILNKYAMKLEQQLNGYREYNEHIATIIGQG